MSLTEAAASLYLTTESLYGKWLNWSRVIDRYERSNTVGAVVLGAEMVVASIPVVATYGLFRAAYFATTERHAAPLTADKTMYDVAKALLPTKEKVP